jgi:hypothetical protein
MVVLPIAISARILQGFRASAANPIAPGSEAAHKHLVGNPECIEVQINCHMVHNLVDLRSVKFKIILDRVAHHGAPMHRTDADTGAPQVRQKLAPVHRANSFPQLQELVKAVMCAVC